MRGCGLGAAAVLAGLLAAGAAQAGPRVVAAENFYADVAEQVAGPLASVSAILSNPDQDPHLFEASPSVARSVAGARIVVENGAGYDPWMAQLLAGAPAPGRQVIVVAELTYHRDGDNPHLWYDPATMPAVAQAVADALAAVDPAHRDAYAHNAATFDASLATLREQVATLHRRYAGTQVAATEPVFGYMAQALGLSVREQRFQLAIMNDTEPAAADVAAFEDDLRRHRVRALLYNSQATEPATQRLLVLARQAGVPVVGVSETEPPGSGYREWMMRQLDALDRALSQHAS